MQKQFTAEQPGRLDSFLAESLPDYTRSMLQKLCQQGNAAVNGQIAKVSHRLHSGDKVTIDLPDSAPPPQEIPIIYQDHDVVVFNKPAGVLTHSKGAFNAEFTVADAMRPLTTDSPESNRPGIVHRLDRDTSGVLIAARSAAAKSRLQKQFSQRKAKKTYLALVEGVPKQPRATMDLPIARNPKKPQTFRVAAGGKPAITEYETLKVYPNGRSLLRLSPQTGRTHQLRVHLAYIGCPIIGDFLYGKSEPGLGRMFLHAESLEITVNSQRLTFKAPLPDELQKFLET